MRLGRLDVCLTAAHVGVTADFYRKLGFEMVEGNVEEGWAILTDGEARLGIFAEQFMGEKKFSLNFRGGNIRKLAASLTEAGLEVEPKFAGERGGTIKLFDPDGNLVFLDSSDAEIAALEK